MKTGISSSGTRKQLDILHQGLRSRGTSWPNISWTDLNTSCSWKTKPWTGFFLNIAWFKYQYVKSRNPRAQPNMIVHCCCEWVTGREMWHPIHTKPATFSQKPEPETIIRNYPEFSVQTLILYLTSWNQKPLSLSKIFCPNMILYLTPWNQLSIKRYYDAYNNYRQELTFMFSLLH